ncbi:MAG: RagB/SusD family nutrient uptake outer membrane protein [Bacteroidales bacterium]|nr:RagB/SusD family nutrient uptake outer membrane protein [Bacteroidales bacterium]
MKNISIFILLAASLLAVSCSGWLQEEPRTESDGTMYSDVEYQARTNFLYRHGAGTQITGAGSAYIGPNASLNGMLTGYFVSDYESQETHCKEAGELTREQNTADISSRYSEGVWESCYQAINVANQIIGTINAPAKYVAEAKFFRAFNYFFLVKTFRSIPMPLAYTDNSYSENLSLGQSEPDAVFEQIKKDLEEAAEVLPQKTFVANGHRISAAVANMALADVCLYRGDYAAAATAAKAVINTEGQDLLGNGATEDDSYINRLRTTEDHSEVVYSYEFNLTKSPSDWWPTYAFDTRATNVFDKYAIYTRVYGVDNGFLNVYEDGDLRAKERQFFVWEYHNGATDQTWTASDADHPGSFYYFDKAAMEETGVGTHDWNIYRLAEAYLDAAEAIAQSEGVTNEALSYLNAIRKRAGLAELENPEKTAFIEACWTERLREFPLEFKIWDDVVRTRRFPVINANHTVTYVPLESATNARGASFSGKSLYWPIGLLQLQRNPNLNQIDGYASK